MINLLGKISKITIPFWIILAVVLFVFSFKPIYYIFLDNSNLIENTGYSRDLVEKNYNYLIDYNLSSEKKDFSLPDFTHSPEGKVHFEEVRNIIQTVIIFFVIFTFTSIFGIYYSVKKKNINVLLEVGITILLFPLLLIMPFIVSFKKSFVVFHKLLFRNDYWIFDPKKDPIISILPENFFFFTALVILVLLFSVSVLSICFYLKLRKSNSDNSPC